MDEIEKLRREVKNLKLIIEGLNNLSILQSRLYDKRLDDLKETVDLLHEQNQLMNKRLNIHSDSIVQIYELMTGEEA